jgi:hypothetical protein
MKTKLLLSLILSFCFCLLSSQVPQGLNYQAIARDGSGNPIANATIKVMLSILSDTAGFYSSGSGTYLWEEEQTNVKTNAFGLITVVLGNPLASKVQGTASSFSAIDWAKTPLYIGTKIANPTNYKIMGSAKLWSVPYSMVSSGLSGTLKKLGVTGVTTSPDSALFEVKNRNGQTVFAVYNEGVRVYVDDGIAKSSTKGGFAIGGFGTVKSPSQEFFRVTRDSTRIYLNNALGKSTKGGFAIGGFDVVKGVNQNLLTVSDDSVRVYIDTNPLKGVTKGGFAIGGFDQVKAHSQEYLRVTHDSTRVYINNQSGKGATKGGFAIGGFDVVKDGNASFFDVATDANGMINPSQKRVLWYPIKNAFLTGKVLIEKSDSVGENSFASGYESKAKGQYSQALGYQAIARGNYSTSIGYQSVAQDSNSFAFGQWAQARNKESYAFGRGAIAEGFRSFAFGSAGVDSAGKKTGVAYAKGDYSFAIGQGSQALGLGAISIGIADTTKGDFSIVLGYQSRSCADRWVGHTKKFNAAMAIGYRANADGLTSLAIGAYTSATGILGIAIGYNDKASGQYSLAIGEGNQANGSGSTAMGQMNVASNYGSTAIGNQTVSSGYNSTAIGFMTNASGNRATALGGSTNASGAFSTAIGYGTYATGYYSTAMSSFTYAKPYASLAFGQYNDTSCSASGQSSWVSSDPVLIIGNGTYSTNSNALTLLKNGCLGLQSVIAPTYALQLPNSTDIAGGSGRAYAWTTYSDSRLKENQVPLAYGLKELMELSPMQYMHHSSIDQSTWATENIPRTIGLIAQDVYKVIPEAVDVPENLKTGLWGLNYDKLIPVLVKAIQEQQNQIESYKSDINILQVKVEKIESQQKEIDKLETLVNSLVANQNGQGNK